MGKGPGKFMKNMYNAIVILYSLGVEDIPEYELTDYNFMKFRRFKIFLRGHKTDFILENVKKLL